MSANQASVLFYLFLPFTLALMPGREQPMALLSKASAATLARILILIILGRTVVLQGEVVSVNASLVQGYPLDILLSLNPYRYGFLLVAEFCFLLAHWLCPPSGKNSSLIRVLVGFAQGFCSLFALADNSVTAGGFLLLAGTVFFYLVRFSMPDQAATEGEDQAKAIATRMHVLFFLLGLIMISWGIAEFSERGLIFGRGTGSLLGLGLWLGLVILSVPLPPWSRWFSRAVELLPEGVALTVVIFLCCVALKVAALFSVAYPDLGWMPKLLLYTLGILGCGLSIGSLFAANTRRRMLGCLPSFFLSIVLVSVGVSESGLVLSAYFACIFVPVFSGLVLSASAMNIQSNVQKVFVALLLVLVLGLPGTPVYQIFSGIGARSLDLGIGYTIVFGLLWFFYFNANVHICRRFFMDAEPIESGEPAVRIDGGRGLYAGYGIFLMLLVIVVAQIAGRIL